MMLPWLLLHFIARKTTQSSTDADATKNRNYSVQWLLGSAVFAAILFAISTIPPFLDTNIPFSRASIVNIVLSGMPIEGDYDKTASKRLALTSLKLTPQPAQTTKKNVVIVVLESTRARSVSVYND